MTTPKTLTVAKARAALALKGCELIVLQCSGYVRLQASNMASGRVVAAVETTDCTPAEARARLVAAVTGAK